MGPPCFPAALTTGISASTLQEKSRPTGIMIWRFSFSRKEAPASPLQIPNMICSPVRAFLPIPEFFTGYPVPPVLSAATIPWSLIRQSSPGLPAAPMSFSTCVRLWNRALPFASTALRTVKRTKGLPACLPPHLMPAAKKPMVMSSLSAVFYLRFFLS